MKISTDTKQKPTKEEVLLNFQSDSAVYQHIYLNYNTGWKVQFPQNGNYMETMRKPEVDVSPIVYALRKLLYGFQMVSICGNS